MLNMSLWNRTNCSKIESDQLSICCNPFLQSNKQINKQACQNIAHVQTNKQTKTSLPDYWELHVVVRHGSLQQSPLGNSSYLLMMDRVRKPKQSMRVISMEHGTFMFIVLFDINNLTKTNMRLGKIISLSHLSLTSC